MNCTHVNQIQHVTPITPNGCEEFLETGNSWIHPRLCLICGHVGCCNCSLNRYATKHFHQTNHHIIQSFQPDESWRWCYIVEEALP